MKFLLPLILLLVGTGSGVAVARFLGVPVEEPSEPHDMADCGPVSDNETEQLVAAEVNDPDSPAAGLEYARLNNQFIIPVVQEDRVSALVVLSLSVEVQSGQKDLVFAYEPRLRDAMLQVMFDHANMGGFDGVFTASDNMGSLRAALRTVAREEVGPQITDVLVLDVVRQEVPG